MISRQALDLPNANRIKAEESIITLRSQGSLRGPCDELYVPQRFREFLSLYLSTIRVLEVAAQQTEVFDVGVWNDGGRPCGGAG